MFKATRKYLTLTLLLSGLLAPSLLIGAGKDDISEIEIVPDTSTKAVNTPTPQPAKPAVKPSAPTPTNVVNKTTAVVPTPTKIVPVLALTQVATQVKPVAPTPTKIETKQPEPTPIPTKIEIKKMEPTSTPVNTTPRQTPLSAKDAPVSTGSQFSLSLDLGGQLLFQSLTGQSFVGGGGQIFFDWRPIRVISFGLGGQFTYFPGTPSFNLGTIDLGGRIFPLPPGSTPGGEFYLQGGMGLNLALNVFNFALTGWPGHFHGYAGPGYRSFLSRDLALDLGAQYDFYSPFGDVGHGVSAKVGLTFLFGRTEWPKHTEDEEAEEEVSLNGYHKGDPFYTWKAGDNLRNVSARVFGDPDLFSFLADSNWKILSRQADIRIGTQFVVPTLPTDDDVLENYRIKSRTDKYYLKLLKLSQMFGYEQVQNWKGPKTYRWKKGDNLLSVAETLYGDSDLYPVLVNANEKRLIHPVNLKPGATLLVPAPPAGDWVDTVHLWGWNKDPYIWWKEASQNANLKNNKEESKP